MIGNDASSSVSELAEEVEPGETKDFGNAGGNADRKCSGDATREMNAKGVSGICGSISERLLLCDGLFSGAFLENFSNRSFQIDRFP